VTTKPPTTVTELLDSCRPQPPAKPNILKTLLTIQQANGYVPFESIPRIARTLGVTEADVAGVLSYYPDLRTEAPGRHVVRVCMGESCMANHCDRVHQAVHEYLGGLSREAAATCGYTVEKTYCMGNCALSPTVSVDDNVHGRVWPEQIATLLEPYR
jgi:NADH:ubiquinone oxidoreductase subunit E